MYATAWYGTRTYMFFTIYSCYIYNIQRRLTVHTIHKKAYAHI